MRERDALHTLELSRVLIEASAVFRHDLRNRLGSIRNMAFFVKKRVKDSEPAARDPRIVAFLDNIDAEIERATAMMEAWGERVTNLHEHRLTRVLASSVLDLAVKSARIDPGVDVRIACDDTTLECDPLELALALRCLLENAAEAAPAGGIDVSAAPSNGRYQFTVRDRGPGISDPDAAQKRFESGKAGHLGIGLAMCRRLLDMVSGELDLSAPPGGGGEVRLSLPLPHQSLRALPAEGTFGE